MTYGTIDPVTAIWLREDGFDMAWDITDYANQPDIAVDIMFHGALDESFNINDMYDPADIVACIAKHMRLRSEWTNWEVIAYRDEGDIIAKETHDGR